MQTTTVKIATREYRIDKLKIKKNREWRHKFEMPINKLLNATKAIGQLTNRDFDKTTDLLKEIGAVLLLHADEIVRVLISSVDTINEAVFEYSPAMAADRSWIEDNGDDEEMVNAFIEVAKLAYPFSGVFQAMTKLGQMAEQTSPNSPGLNGESTKTN